MNDQNILSFVRSFEPLRQGAAISATAINEIAGRYVDQAMRESQGKQSSVKNSESIEVVWFFAALK